MNTFERDSLYPYSIQPTAAPGYWRCVNLLDLDDHYPARPSYAAAQRDAEAIQRRALIHAVPS